MIKIIQMRWLLWKKQRLSVTFWLLLPFIATFLIIYPINQLESEVNIPIGLVVEEKSPLVNILIDHLEQDSTLNVKLLTKDEALQQLLKHELDSVFVLHKNYEKNIESLRKDRLVTAYQSDLSFAYGAVRETILSYIQQDYMRERTVKNIYQLKDKYQINQDWEKMDIIEKGKTIEKEQQLLSIDFQWIGSHLESSETKSSLNVWGIWALVNLLATFMLFDWVVKERFAPAIQRLAFSPMTFRRFLLFNFIFMTLLMLIFDLVTIFSFSLIFEQAISFSLLSSIVVFRLTMNMIIFYMSQLFKKSFSYYTVSFTIVLFIALFSQVFIPFHRPWLKFIHPIVAVLEEQSLTLWIPLSILFIVISLQRKEEFYA